MVSARLREYNFLPFSFSAPDTPSKMPNVLPMENPASSPPQDTFSGWALTDNATSSANVLNASDPSSFDPAVVVAVSSSDWTWNAFIISAMLSVGRALVSAPQMTSRKSESETSAFWSLGVLLSTATTFFSDVVVVLGKVKSSKVFWNRFLRPSTHTSRDSSTGSGSSTTIGSAFFSTLGLPRAPKLNPEKMLAEEDDDEAAAASS
mmetsp:Transcript_13458/g.29225  ORF Transcript_13458/g.29225 Transcript_13458/m.29225 type:complete len:206 (+) Transcript_13458:857-1474(+)